MFQLIQQFLFFYPNSYQCSRACVQQSDENSKILNEKKYTKFKIKCVMRIKYR